VTIALRPRPSKPLPIILRPLPDELLSSWLRRTAHVYAVSAGDVLTHFGIVRPDPLRQTDFAQSAQIKARLAWGLRTTASRIHRAGHPVPAWRAKELVAIDVPVSHCAACEQAWSSSSPTLRPRSRSWYEAWRVRCGFCGRPFHLGASSSPPNSDAVLVTDCLWRDAIKGSELFERYLLGLPCGWLPPRLIWSLASIPVRLRRRLQRAFELIVPEASASTFGIREATCATTCRTMNPFRRVAMMAAIQRYNQDPLGWLRKLSSAATEAGRAAIARLLSTLPEAIAGPMRGDVPVRFADSGFQCQAVEVHQVRLKLAVNLRQIHAFCRELDVAGPNHNAESHG
jgi:TniQ